MARTVIPVVEMLPRYGGAAQIDATYAIAPDATNDHEVENDGKMFLEFENYDNAATKAFTIKSVANEYGRTSDITVTCAIAGSATTPVVRVAGPFKPPHWNNGAGRLMDVDTAVASGASIAAYKFQF